MSKRDIACGIFNSKVNSFSVDPERYFMAVMVAADGYFFSSFLKPSCIKIFSNINRTNGDQEREYPNNRNDFD